MGYLNDILNTSTGSVVTDTIIDTAINQIPGASTVMTVVGLFGPSYDANNGGELYRQLAAEGWSQAKASSFVQFCKDYVPALYSGPYAGDIWDEPWYGSIFTPWQAGYTIASAQYGDGALLDKQFQPLTTTVDNGNRINMETTDEPPYEAPIAPNSSTTFVLIGLAALLLFIFSMGSPSGKRSKTTTKTKNKPF